MFEHIMLDLETLDNTPTSVILSIGAVRFDFTRKKLGSCFYSRIDASTCQEAGMTIGARTVEWWMKQSDEAREALYCDTRRPIEEVLQDFNKFVLAVKNSYVWGNGSTFDNIILRNAFRCCKVNPAWSYTNDLCFRTMLRMFPVNRERVGVFHNALDDAKSQAQTLIQIVGGLK